MRYNNSLAIEQINVWNDKVDVIIPDNTNQRDHPGYIYPRTPATSVPKTRDSLLIVDIDTIEIADPGKVFNFSIGGDSP